MKIIDLTGQTFGCLIVERKSDYKGSSAKWVCKCSCGKTVEVFSHNLRNGYTKSCGHTRITNSDSRTSLYRKYYKKRTIGVCPEWNTYEKFKEWAYANGYQEGYYIQRRDTNLPFSPENCFISESK